MDNSFVGAVNRKVKALKKQHFFREEIVEEIMRLNVRKNYKEISDYDIGFFMLYESQKKVERVIGKHLDLLNNQDYFREDISQGFITMVRELRLPEDQSDKWQLLYETTLVLTNNSGPILHLCFEGWELAQYKVYYWDQAATHDVSETVQAAEAREKIAAYGLDLDDRISDEGALLISKLLGSHLK